ncbi:MAG: hypothetical protein ABI175_13015 [Polyangiales bacterium]
MAEMTQKPQFAIGKGATSHHDPLALKLDSLHTTLQTIEKALARGAIAVPLLSDLTRLADEIAGYVDAVGPDVRENLSTLVSWVRALPAQLEARLAGVGPSRELPSRPLLGKLPVARVVPQDVHSVIDYANALGALSTAIFADSTTAKIAGAALGASGATVSLLTDYRLSVAKIIPIEAHEAIDHGWGLLAIAAPFALGYYRKDPATAALHVMLGASTILVSLFTDYRAAEGVGRTAPEGQE